MAVINKIIDILSNSNLLNFISTVVVAIISYLAARYSSSKPNKLKIKQLQLDNVYLPLFRLYERTPRKISVDYAKYLYEETSFILDTHYELVFPHLHKLNRKLGVNIRNSEVRTETISRIRHQVIVDYELLKKSLGYPSESLFKLYIRTSNKRKLGILIIITGMIFVLYTLIPMVYNSIIINKNPIIYPNNIITMSMIFFYIKVAFSQIKKLLKY